MSILKGKTAVVTGSTSGIGLGRARAFAGAGANIVLNGIGAPADVEKTRTAIENDFGVKAIYSSANMGEPMEIAHMISLAEKTFGRVDVLVNNAGIHIVSPIEEFPVEKVGRCHRNQPLFRIPCDPCRYSWHEATRLGPNHKYGVGAFAGRIAIQVCLRRSQARHSRSYQDSGAGARAIEDHVDPHQPRRCLWTPLVEKQIPKTMKARNMSEDQVIKDVLLAAQPTKEFVTVEQVASLALFLCGQDAAQITGANLSIDGGWTAA